MTISPLPQLVALVVTSAVLLPVMAQDVPPKDAPKPEAKPEVVLAKTPDGITMPAGALQRFGNRQARHPDGISGSAVSPDGKYLATLGSTTIIVWDVQTMNAKCIIRDQNVQNAYYGGAARATFLPDSKHLLVSLQPDFRQFQAERAPMSDVVRVFEVETGKLKFAVKGNTDCWTGAWLAAGNKEIATFNRQSIAYHDAKDGKELRKIPCGPDLRGLLAIAPVGNIGVFRRNDNNTLSVIDTATGKEHSVLTVEMFVRVALTPDGKRLAVVDSTGKIHIHDLEAKKELFAFKQPAANGVVAMQFSADQQTLYFGGQHGRLYRWDLKNNKKMPDVGSHSTWTLSGITLSPDETMLYSTGNDRLVRRWDLKTLKELPLPEGYITQTAIVLLPDRKTMLIADHAGAIDQWDLQTGKLVKRLQEQKSGGIDCVAVSADGRWFAGGRTVQDVTLWDLKAGKLERIIPLVAKPDPKGSDHVKRVAFSGDGKVLFTSSGKTGITAWEVPTGKRLWNTPSIGSGTGMAVDPKGRWIAIGGGFDTEQVQWTMLNQTTGAVVRRIDVQPSEEVANQAANQFDSYMYPPYISDLRFAPDGLRLITVHYDQTVRTWNPETGHQTSRMKGNGQMVSLAVSADGRWAGVGQGDKKITIWELATGKLVWTLSSHDSGVRDVAFTPDGRGIVGNADLAPILWTLDPRDGRKAAASAEEIWTGLASDQATLSYAIQWSLIRDAATAVKVLSEKVKPAELALDRVKFDKWVADLDSGQFRIREAAERDLTKAGMRVPLNWLRRSLDDSRSDESRARLTRVLAQRQKPHPDEWRLGRAIQVLELAATDEAKALLKSWSVVDGSPVTEASREALERLGGR